MDIRTFCVGNLTANCCLAGHHRTAAGAHVAGADVDGVGLRSGGGAERRDADLGRAVGLADAGRRHQFFRLRQRAADAALPPRAHRLFRYANNEKKNTSALFFFFQI